MISLRTDVLYILFLTEFILGNFANGFIVVVNCFDWIKRQKISLVNQMLVALSVSRIGLLWITLMSRCAILKADLFGLRLFMIANIVWLLSNHFSVWLTASLSVFYLLKIAIFSRAFFIYLKRRVRSVVHIILLGSLPFLLYIITVTGIDENAWVNRYEGNMTCKTKSMDTMHFSNMIVFTLANFIPFAMSLASLVLLIYSLWSHLKKMKLSGTEFQDPRVKVHLRAMQTVISFLLLLISYFVAIIILFWHPQTVYNKWVIFFCQTLLGLCPSIHSLFLIWGNKKLQRVFLPFLWKLRFRLKGRKEVEW